MPIIGQISVGDGATFTPAVDNDGKISWTNNKNLPNPATVDIPQAVVDRYQLAPTSNPTFTGTVTAEDVTASGDVGVGGDLSVTGAINGDLTGNVTGNVTGDVIGNLTGTASGNLPLAGGTMGGAIKGNPLTLTADDGNNSADLVLNPNGSLTWGGNSVVTKKAENISSSVSVTTNNGTITSKAIYKVGNLVQGQINFKLSTAVNVGGSITGAITGLPASLVTFIQAGGYVGSTFVAASFVPNNNSYTLRIIGANLGVSSEFAITFMYATVS